MGFTVREFLQLPEMERMQLIVGEEGLDKDIKGATIIETPDIVRWINGGELLLTGFYAFKDSSPQEVHQYIYSLKQKSPSCLVVKFGKSIDNDENFQIIKDFSEQEKIPLVEVPYDMSFQVIMSVVMERLFNDEVTLLKYYKLTRDNFEALTRTPGFKQRPIYQILNMLKEMIRNPIALYNQNFNCYAYTDEEFSHFELSPDARLFEPSIVSNSRYYMQKGENDEYIVRVQLNIGIKMYLVVTETMSKVSHMDWIAVESAIVALQYEFSRHFAVTELEKKYQNDILNNLINGKVTSYAELKKSTTLLGLNIEDHYRVLVFSVRNELSKEKELDEKIKNVNFLEEMIAGVLPKLKIHKDLDTVVALMTVTNELTQKEYRDEIQGIYDKVQAELEKKNKHLKLCIGAGKIIHNITIASESYKEAKDALSFLEITGDMTGKENSEVMLFSDMGIFKLLSQLKDVETLREYVPESLQKLLDYKKPQQEDLIITLKTYLDYNQNLSKTSQELYVHYKTAAYRIDKISKITGMDFNNSNEMLAVRIGLVVNRMIENTMKK